MLAQKHAWLRAVAINPRRTDSLTPLHHIRGKQARLDEMNDGGKQAQAYQNARNGGYTNVEVSAKDGSSSSSSVATSSKLAVENADELTVACSDDPLWQSDALFYLRQAGAVRITGLLKGDKHTAPAKRRMRSLYRATVNTTAAAAASKSSSVPHETTNTTLQAAGRKHIAVSLLEPPLANALAAAAPKLMPFLCKALSCDGKVSEDKADRRGQVHDDEPLSFESSRAAFLLPYRARSLSHCTATSQTTSRQSARRSRYSLALVR